MSHLVERATASVVVAIVDPDNRELVARITEGTGNHAVRLEDCSPLAVVDTAVHEMSLVCVVDTLSTTLDELGQIVAGFSSRSYPAGVIALVDGPVAHEQALARGAALGLTRPFHQRDLERAIGRVLDPGSVPAEPAPPAEPAASRDRPAPLDVGHAFTDILRMGRQL